MVLLRTGYTAWDFSLGLRQFLDGACGCPVGSTWEVSAKEIKNTGKAIPPSRRARTFWKKGVLVLHRQRDTSSYNAAAVQYPI